MKQPKVLVLVGYGINCDNETQFAFQKAGAKAERIHINELIDKTIKLEDYHIFFIPGGFAYGDELGAGKVLANKLKLNLGDQIFRFIKDGYLVGGHCNGAQVLIKAGFIPAINDNYGIQTATLTNNESNRYEDRWVTLKNVSKKCIWTKGLPIMRVPVAHGEGRFYSKDPKLVDKLKENDQIALVYVMPDGSPANMTFPYNPNGSVQDIAGICDSTGRVFAQMPHPERYTSMTNHPQWTKKVRELLRKGKHLEQINWDGEGLLLFKNAVQYAVENLV